MAERLFQLRFGENGEPTAPQNVTPTEFNGLTFPIRSKNTAPDRVPELGRFIREASETIQVIDPQSAARYLLTRVYHPFEQFDQEETWALLLNNKHWITHDVMIYRGTVNQGLIRMAEVFKPAVRVNAPALILAHNHPSGDPSPSPEDIAITRQLEEAGQHLQIDFLDHIIVGNGRWVSLKERGLGFTNTGTLWR